ncbi:hypothetical protein HOY82DRAFT_271753 [Tuber indicum]|nr:hypothetical protein HOY82DRAFT_271753 [Tuber indicum]
MIVSCYHAVSYPILSYPIVNNETRRFFILFTISNISSAPSPPPSNTRTLSSNFSPCGAPVCILRLRTEGPRRRYTKRVECLSSFSPPSLPCPLPDWLHYRPQIDHLPLPSLPHFILAEEVVFYTVSGHRLVLNSCEPFLVHRSPSPPLLHYLTPYPPPPPLATFLWFNSLPLSLSLVLPHSRSPRVALSAVSGIYRSSGTINPLLACSLARLPAYLLDLFLLFIYLFILWSSPPRVSCSNRVHSSCRLSPCLLLVPPPHTIPYTSCRSLKPCF